ncbi:MAG: RdgB/HAM1 family non-canonical purine NTP pyrophosphatase [Nitrospirae bacterium]|nr:RdgB/HAM1 family non-canonical purine NTP pyrophosphatase [Nitrospirota bacterium]
MSNDVTILIATRNEGKFSEINALLSDLPLNFVSLNGLEGTLDMQENGSSYEANAVMKAKAGSQKFQMVCLGEDSGLEVEALGKMPGLHSARYAGDDASEKDNNRKLLRELTKKKVLLEKRVAHFVCAVGLAMPDGRVFSSSGTVKGVILSRARGRSGFGYDPLFFLPEFKKTFAQMSLAEKNRLSHRARAIEGIRKYLKKLV